MKTAQSEISKANKVAQNYVDECRASRRHAIDRITETTKHLRILRDDVELDPEDVDQVVKVLHKKIDELTERRTERLKKITE